ncbi:glycosyltransferase family 39 protein [Kineothrix sp. MSJ-39]|uniref:ArnT family glycosyltransferase n=1 Tax=Kineothrix sp. MSJ-39 TaxID=2841533 RepID=UPI001C129288|nr:glycosyltransferase family 39 protein [Kineothrix sp. MSJ-39]MBU5429787.1 glycosyltransferase family 39 protein [Kineothrix sp. MSJ-39]
MKLQKTELKSNIKAFFSPRMICLMLLLLGAAARFFYAYAVPYYNTNHDLGDPSDWQSVTYGHLGYIQYLYQYQHLPDFSPEFMGQYYHPPLFYIIGAIVLRLFFYPTGDLTYAFEMLQYVNMAFSVLISVFLYLILKQLKVPEKLLCCLTALVSFFPTLFFLGAQLNNDCLMTLFCVMALFYTLRWHIDPDIGNILKIAAAVILATLSKTSGVLIAPGIGVVFLYHLIKTKDKKALLKQYILFAVICIPLSLSWVIRNRLLYGLPFSYVVDATGYATWQNVAGYGFAYRMGFPTLRIFTAHTIDWWDLSNSANIWGQTILTLLYDEGILVFRTPFMEMLASVFTLLGFALSLILFCTSVSYCFSKEGDPAIRLLIGIGNGALLLSYVIFCFRYPLICTMNARYIFSGYALLFPGYALWRMQHPDRKYILFEVLMPFFGFLSLLLYLFCPV